jgi:L-aspartate oxidase
MPQTPSPTAPLDLACDVLIIGSGLAGLSTALHLADTQRVVIVTKNALGDGSSAWAQGGIAAVLGKEDSFSAHIDDTLIAGAGLCDTDATAFTVEHAPEAVAWLQSLGVPFTTEDGQLHLTREGGHSQRRIVHVTDATGAAVQQVLVRHIRQHKNIQVLEQHMLVDLVTTKNHNNHNNNHNNNDNPDSTDIALQKRCVGAYVLHEGTDSVMSIAATHTVLATGGAGKVYLYTTNPDSATGDGIASAWRAGCRVANMEFIQFHPTCLFHPHAKSFLISEAVRGEGGHLVLPNSVPHVGGKRFMLDHDPRAELAPRDIVARAIDFEMKKHGVDCVYLDISHKDPEFLKTHFPNISARCLELGIDMTKQGIPVVPAAHYTCGGVVTDLYGQTDLAGLLAVGETTCTGLHGANRLASNSLVECMVFARAAAAQIQRTPAPSPAPFAPWDDSQVCDADEMVVVSHNWAELRRCMWNYVGIVRTTKRLERAAHRIALLQAEIQEFYAQFHVTRDLLELRNLVQVADLIVQSALTRKESRGLHFSRDYPEQLPTALPTVIAGQ